MRVSDELRQRKRGRPRKFVAEDTERVTGQPVAFPQEDTTPPAAELEENAAEKEKVKRAMAAIPEIFTPEQVEWVFDAYVAILSFVYSIALKTDFDAIQTELEFSKEQKEMLSKPLARICSKYAPPSWAGMSAEIQLVTMLGVWTVASFQRARNVARAQEEKKRDAERTQPVAPMRRREPQAEIHVPA